MRQPPAHSPLPWRALRASAGAVLRRRDDARPALRQLLAREFAAADVALFASGTQALQMALTVAGNEIGSNATVALPAFTCFDVATAAVGAGLRISLYDIDPVTLTPDLDSLRGALADLLFEIRHDGLRADSRRACDQHGDCACEYRHLKATEHGGLLVGASVPRRCSVVTGVKRGAAMRGLQ